MRQLTLLWICFTCVCFVHAQTRSKHRNIIVVTLDGFRWQEVFRGGEPALMNNRKYSPDRESIKKYQGKTCQDRRAALLPFFWSTVRSEGQLYGNRDIQSRFNCSNPFWFSYPGYHEIFVGAINRKVCSNMKIKNPDVTVLEFLNTQTEYTNSVAAFATWDVFPYILRESCSGISVNVGPSSDLSKLSQDDITMNKQELTTGKRTDSITFHKALHYLERARPKVLYIALDETDHYAHADRYDLYLKAAQETDLWLGQLWDWIQSDSAYRNNTTLLITTDHGRGRNSKKTWRHHGRLTSGSNQIWMAAIGPDTPATGEMKDHEQLYQKQIAASIGTLAGFIYVNDFPVGNTIQSLVKMPSLIAEEKPESRKYAANIK